MLAAQQRDETCIISPYEAVFEVVRNDQGQYADIAVNANHQLPRIRHAQVRRL